MFDNLKDFLLNKALGRIAVRLVGSFALTLASGKLGMKVELTPEQQLQLVGAVVGGFNGLVSWLKPRLPKMPDVKAVAPEPLFPAEGPMKPFDAK